jgi:hypothetical protein
VGEPQESREDPGLLGAESDSGQHRGRWNAYDPADPDTDEVVCSVIRNRQVIEHVILSYHPDTKSYIGRTLDGQFFRFSTSFVAILTLAEAYLEGYAKGYDHGSTDSESDLAARHPHRGSSDQRSDDGDAASPGDCRD